MLYFKPALASLMLPLNAGAKPTVYLIRHGEKPSEGNGLSAQGERRAQCLRDLLGASSAYNIGHIMAQTPKKDGRRQRPYDTVAPLARDLGISVDISCDRDDIKCVAKVIKKYKGPGNILICWEHDALSDIVMALGDYDPPSYPEERFDLIWNDAPPYKSLSNITTQHCPSVKR